MWRRLLIPKRRGTTLVETIIALIVMGLAVNVMTRLTAVRLTEQESLDNQYVMVALDSYLSDIYHSFHACDSYTIETNDHTGYCRITFQISADVGAAMYEFQPATGKCYFNGIEQFECSEFKAVGTMYGIYISVKLPHEREIELNIYK